jgi:dihydroneopterin aldolase
MDKIFLKELTTEAVIGIFGWEREVKQTVAIDLEMSADIRRAARTDSINDTLNYKAVAKRVLAFVEESRYQLVETLAEAIANVVLTEFPVDWVRVTLHKPGAIRHSKDVGVIIERERDATMLDA